MKKTLSGAASGKGTVYEWEGNSKAGKGRMEITESSAPNKITIQLDPLVPRRGRRRAHRAAAKPRGGRHGRPRGAIGEDRAGRLSTTSLAPRPPVHWDLTLAGLDPQRQVKVLEALAQRLPR
jgi:hypothetical protein